MQMRYAPYCVADSTFYEPLHHVEDAHSRFPVSDRTLPSNWECSQDGVWLHVHPTGIQLPAQGWKIHVSGTPTNADAVLGVVWDFGIEHRIPFKFLRSRTLLWMTNAKHAGRASSGKLATLYPAHERQLEVVLTGLGAALDGFDGPYVLSDVRWGDGPLYVRYGGFLQRHCIDRETGQPVPAIESPDGELVPDARQPFFQLPSWVEVPDCLASTVDSRLRSGGGEGFPYRIDSALHFSNGGGVYLAEDPSTAQQVVLKEARPHAGLDAHGLDAVARLHRERAALERLSALDSVPKLLGSFTYWEHHFLVQEHVDGESLQQAMAERHPLIRGEPTAAEIEEYTAWALHTLAAIEGALAALHRHGLVYGDLNWQNVLITGDGQVKLIDFEAVTEMDAGDEPGLGTHGFVSERARSGVAVDHYALACTRLALFLPLTFLFDKDADKVRTLVQAVTERFPVPEDFGTQVLADLIGSSAAAPSDSPRPERLFEDDGADWTAIRDSIVGGISASATPQRHDRLFPGDIDQYRYGGFTFAYGAAGVLYALHRVGSTIDREHAGWLIRATRAARAPSAGFYNGLHGVAYALDALGLREEALNVLDRALQMGDDLRNVDLFGGQAGIALNTLRFARETGDESLRHKALRCGEDLLRTVKEEAAGPGSGAFDPPARVGLLHGFSGVALLFITLYEESGDGAFLDWAEHALQRDLAHCRVTPDGTLQVHADARINVYLGEGSAGIGMVLNRYLRHRHDEELALRQAQIAKGCQAEFMVEPGLFRGRAGLIAYLSSDGVHDREAIVQRHIRRLAWHVLPYAGQAAFPGAYLFRLSMDLATGSAGILLALHAARADQEGVLPFLGG